MANARGFLIKLAHDRGAAAAAAPRLAAAGGIGLRKLFDAPPSPGAPLAAADRSHAWYVVEGDAGRFGAAAAASDHPWDLAHAMLGQGLAVDGAPDIVAVEPDFEQSFYPEAAPRQLPLAAARSDPNVPAPQKGEPYAPGPGFAWHLHDDYSGLAAARDSLGLSLTGPASQSNVTIVHLDTGFDPDHKAAPAFIKEQKNLVERDAPTAQDQTPDRPWDQRAHGTGTLGILAGRRLDGMRPAEADGVVLGGAAPLQIVPVRIANTVYHIRTSTVAEGIAFATGIAADVVSMSMGGLSSAAWADAVNLAYDSGVVVVCAAGNNWGGLPTSLIVYPARFGRVIAACGVMANRTPYFHLPIEDIEGNVGPASKMTTALAAFTPNIPWARLGIPDMIDEDGGGTSAATPQIAAAAGLWLHKNGDRFPVRDWRRAEAARRALFDSADPLGSNSAMPSPYYGRGLLRAQQGLQLAQFADLAPMPADTAQFAFLHLLSSLFGIGPLDRHADMLALELTQLALHSREAQKAVPDPDLPPAKISEAQRRRFFEAILAERRGSRTLNRFLERALGGSGAVPVPSLPAPPTSTGVAPRAAPPPASTAATRRSKPAPPPNRRLRIFATDPGDATRLETAFINTATVEIPWETAPGVDNLLMPGPVGDYVEVVDVDPASDLAYQPVDLNHPFLLAQDGLPPGEGNPQFHQQMVYAVAMRTIGHFELALGRRVLWASRPLRFRDAGAPQERTKTRANEAAGTAPVRVPDTYVQRLRLYPHALRQANAYYSPDRMALLFGYFPVRNQRRLVFTCLSHDVVAHETTHAVLDGLHRRYQEPTNPDVLAFHEGFADIVAIFQHFTFPELLRYELQRARGDLHVAKLLGGLAREFGRALGHTEALRSAIGSEPDPAAYIAASEPHDRGAILVAATFDAFIAIYQRRTEDLLRLATGGSGVLAPGALSRDLVDRLAAEAAKTARHVLTICIRALDYMPPVDPTFAEYLRALITADSDLVANDRYGYRVAFVEAFGRRGIQPEDLRTLSVQSLRWQTLRTELQPSGLGEFLRARIDLSWDVHGDRRRAHDGALRNAAALHEWLRQFFATKDGPETAHALGLDTGIARFEVHAVRPARRVSPDGEILTDICAIVTQHREVPGRGMLRGGCTLILDRDEGVPPIRYAVIKPVWNDRRADRIAAYQAVAPTMTGLHAMYFGHLRNEPFAVLHNAF